VRFVIDEIIVLIYPVFNKKSQPTIRTGFIYSILSSHSNGHWIIVKWRIFSMFFARNPVKSRLPICSISRNSIFHWIL